MAGIQIASLFATIGADIGPLTKGLRQAESDIRKTSEGITSAGKSINFASLMTGVNQALEIFNKVAYAAKQVYAAMEQSAQLDYASQKFDRLSMSIGSTSALLMGDLRAATRGMVSDAELVASAGDFMALGLAKSHDEVVRLTNVAGQLGMNMNQLVLTLTNQTTMRFDTLGVSVAGFEERVNALKRSGMSANEAFTEAFLQQAEAQLGTVGNAADSSVASFKKFEAAAANLKNELLQGLLPAIIPVVDGLTDAIKDNDLSKFLREIQVLQVANEALGSGKIRWKEFWAAVNMGENWDSPTYMEDTKNWLIEVGQGGAVYESFIAGQEQLERSIFQQSTTWQEYSSNLKEAGLEIGIFSEDAYNAAKGIEGSNSAIARVDLSAARNEYMATASVLREELAGAYMAVMEAEDNWRSGVAGKIKSGLDKELENRTISTEEYAEALGRLDDYAGTQFAYEFKIEENIPDLVKSLLTDPEGFMSKMSGFEDAMMPLDTSVKNAMELVAELQGQLEDLEREYSAYVNIKVRQLNGGLAVGNTSEWAVPHGPQASGGYAVSNTPYIVGERGPEMFVPNANGQIVANNMLGGGSELLGDILMELQNQPSRIKVAMREAMALVGG